MKNNVVFGKLEAVDVRELWKHEQYDFSEWLSKSENIDYLNDILGLTLVNVDKEVYVGQYRCDLVAEDETTGTKVIIENQLEASNHDHLGKIITYASGLNASVVVWIVKEAREEHSSAIEWLNNNTNNNVNFFLLELHAYKIGDSLPAPKFEVIEEPNDFIKQKNNSMPKGENSKTQSERYEFWNKFNEVVTERGKPFNLRKPSTNAWYNVSIGTSDCYITLSLNQKKKAVSVGLYITDNKDLFDELELHKENIENKFGESLEWNRLDDKKASIISYDIFGFSFDNKTNYHELMNKMIDYAIKMRDAFKKYI